LLPEPRSRFWYRALAPNELYILNDTIETEIAARGLVIHKTYVGNYFTSLEMVGATLTVLALDEEIKPLLEVETNCTMKL